MEGGLDHRVAGVGCDRHTLGRQKRTCGVDAACSFLQLTGVQKRQSMRDRRDDPHGQALAGSAIAEHFLADGSFHHIGDDDLAGYGPDGENEKSGQHGGNRHVHAMIAGPGVIGDAALGFEPIDAAAGQNITDNTQRADDGDEQEDTHELKTPPGGKQDVQNIRRARTARRKMSKTDQSASPASKDERCASRSSSGAETRPYSASGESGPTIWSDRKNSTYSFRPGITPM